MDLFDFLDVFFIDDVGYSKLSRVEKSKHYFMTNRFMSIKYPTQANLFNHLKIDTSNVMDQWHSSVGKRYNRIPSFMRTPVKKKAKVKKTFEPNEETIKYYCKLNDCSLKDYYSAIDMFGDTFLDEMKALEKQLS